MIEQTGTQRAALNAINLGNQLNNFVKTHVTLKASGSPAQGAFPAFTKEEYAAALGTAQMAVFDAVAAANPQT